MQRHVGHAQLPVRHQPGAGVDALRTACRPTITEYARPLIRHRAPESRRSAIYAQDRWTINRLTLNLGPPVRLPQRLRAGAGPAGDHVRRGAPLRPDRQRAELEGPVAADRRHLRSLRQRQDGAARQLRQVPRERIDQHGDAEQPGEHVGEQREPQLDRHERQLRPGLQPRRIQAPRTTRAGGDICTALNSPLGSLAIVGGLRSVDHLRLRRPAERPGSRRSASSRRSLRNLSSTSSSRVTGSATSSPARTRSASPSAYDPFCVTPPAAGPANGFTLPNGSVADLRLLQPQSEPVLHADVLQRHAAPATSATSSDVYTGYDVNLNARLPRGGIASGGVSIGHEVTDICDVIGQASVTYAAVAGVLASSSGTIALDDRRTPSTLYCHVAAAVPARHQGAGQLPAAVVGPARPARRSRTGPGRRFSRTTRSTPRNVVARHLGPRRRPAARRRRS